MDAHVLCTEISAILDSTHWLAFLVEQLMNPHLMRFLTCMEAETKFHDFITQLLVEYKHTTSCSHSGRAVSSPIQVVNDPIRGPTPVMPQTIDTTVSLPVRLWSGPIPIRLNPDAFADISVANLVMTLSGRPDELEKFIARTASGFSVAVYGTHVPPVALLPDTTGHHDVNGSMYPSLIDAALRVSHVGPSALASDTSNWLFPTVEFLKLNLENITKLDQIKQIDPGVSIACVAKESSADRFLTKGLVYPVSYSTSTGWTVRSLWDNAHWDTQQTFSDDEFRSLFGFVNLALRIDFRESFTFQRNDGNSQLHLSLTAADPSTGLLCCKLHVPPSMSQCRLSIRMLTDTPLPGEYTAKPRHGHKEYTLTRGQSIFCIFLQAPATYVIELASTPDPAVTCDVLVSMSQYDRITTTVTAHVH